MRLILILLVFAHVACGQITRNQQIALNSVVDYGNQSAKEVTLVTESLKRYYASLTQGKTWTTQRFACPVQPDAYFYDQALKLTQAGVFTSIVKNLQALKTSADSIDRVCKDLDIYYKLEDFKKDTHAHGEEIVRTVPLLMKRYQQRQRELQLSLESAYDKLNKTRPQTAYSKADALMRRQIRQEEGILDQWQLNFNESLHTGWPHEKVFESILESDDHLHRLQKTTINLKYPASSMWNAFQESLSTVVDEKRRAIDEYNYESKKSDKHSNEVYLNLINYFNGTLVSNYNTFIEFSERDQYYGLKYLQYFPSFDIKSTIVEAEKHDKEFRDQPIPALTISQQQAPLQRPAFDALTNYIDFINETWRQVRYLQNVLTSFNSSATYYRTMDNFEKRAAMHFDFQDYEVPVSSYQKSIAASKVLPEGVSKNLNAQSEVLLAILKEMEGQAAFIDAQVKSKAYEHDHLDAIFQKLSREQQLIKVWDEKKEQLYSDVERVYNAYPVNAAGDPWHVSGKALASLVKLDHEVLFLAKRYYQGDSLTKIPTTSLDAMIRDVIAKEYDNMKGIEKLGRNNGLCPYTPYEDLPATSRRFSDKLNHLKPLEHGRNEREYERLIYDYNEVINDYNEFCMLSKNVLLLKNVFQPELFFVIDVENGKQDETKPITAVKEQQQHTAKTPDSRRSNLDSVVVVRDTVYVHQRDTIYLSNEENLNRSMEGFASNNLVLLLDVSGSMNTPDKLPLLKQSVFNIFEMMREEDEIAIVAFSEKANVILKPSSFKDVDKIKKAIGKLKSSGKTDADAGLKIAYKVADDNYIRGGNNRIILATDGQFPLTNDILDLARTWASQDIFLSIFYFGKATGSSSLQNLAVAGKGNYQEISKENAEINLIREAKSKRKK